MHQFVISVNVKMFTKGYKRTTTAGSKSAKYVSSNLNVEKTFTLLYTTEEDFYSILVLKEYFKRWMLDELENEKSPFANVKKASECTTDDYYVKSVSEPSVNPTNLPISFSTDENEAFLLELKGDDLEEALKNIVRVDQ